MPFSMKLRVLVLRSGYYLTRALAVSQLLNIIAVHYAIVRLASSSRNRRSSAHSCVSTALEPAELLIARS